MVENTEIHLLTKDNSNVFRGIAIISIMLHNLLHNAKFGFSAENEMSWSFGKWSGFLSAVSEGHTNIMAETLSFIGWIGVPVFIFLTGYGLSQKHPTVIRGGGFLKNSYLKLLSLIAPALLFFMIRGLCLNMDWIVVLKRVSYLIFVTNFAYPWLECSPGVYWYFGLTFQLYVYYYFCSKYIGNKGLLIISILSLVGMFMLWKMNYSVYFDTYRHCITGWFPCFAIGIWWGGNNHKVNTSWVMELLGGIMLFALAVVMNISFLSWLFVPIVSLVAFCLIGRLLLRTKYVSLVFKWIGRVSASLFVCHPIVLLFVLSFQKVSLIGIVAIYLVLSGLMAFLYDKLYTKLKMLLRRPRSK